MTATAEEEGYTIVECIAMSHVGFVAFRVWNRNFFIGKEGAFPASDSRPSAPLSVIYIFIYSSTPTHRTAGVR